MNWKDQLTNFESEYNWRTSIGLYLTTDRTALSKEDNKNLSLRIMFLLTYFFLEGQYTKEEYDAGKHYANEIYKETSSKFQEDIDYLFCIATIIGLNEDFFGFSTDYTESILNQITELSGNTLLYLYWQNRCGHQYRVDTNYLSNSFVKDFYKSKGLIAKYVFG